MLKKSKKFQQRIELEQEDDIAEFVNNDSDSLLYTLTHGRGPAAYHHLLSPKSKFKVEKAVAILEELQEWIQEHGYQY